MSFGFARRYDTECPASMGRQVALDRRKDEETRDPQRLARALRLRDGLGFLARVVTARANQLFEDLTGQDKITARQYGVLLTLHQRDRLTLTELAAHISVDRSTLTEMVRRLVRDGLVVRSDNGNDRRSAMVTLSSQGEAAVARLTPGAAKVQSVLMARLDLTERRQLLRWMKLMAEADGESGSSS